MSSNLVLVAKDLMVILWYIFLSSFLLWFIANLFMATIKTLFFDVHIKLYRTWNKRLKKYMNDADLEKVLNDMERQKKF